MAIRRQKLGEMLIERDVLLPDQLDEALANQEKTGQRLGEILIRLGFVEAVPVYQALADQFGLEFVAEIPVEQVDADLVLDIPISYAKQHGLLPLYKEGMRVVVLTSNPVATSAIGDLQLLLKAQPILKLATPDVVLAAINHIYDKSTSSANKVIADIEEEESFESEVQHLEEITDILDDPNEAPIIRFVNSLMTQAVKDRASDIHIEPFERELSVRFRIDGLLYEIVRPPKRLQASVISRLKIMSGLNIAEKRLPQDGRIRLKIAGKDIDVRTSTIPVAHGERVVLRLLDRSSTMLGLDEIGIYPYVLEPWREYIRRPHGILLVTGPTGSGKTTTLYGSLTEINQPDINILTVEDPVEYQLPGVGQMQVNPKINLHFASGLRAFLRQDPDVIMVGEIRDGETAEIAIQASLTGHLVLSTLHTNDAAGAVTRLIDMGVEPFLVASSVLGIMAQRLVRRVCPDCREPYIPSDAEIAELGLELSEFSGQTIYRPHSGGCETCLHTGYKGRTGIHELLSIDDEIRQLIMGGVDSGAIKRKAVASSMKSLREDGAAKVLSGVTTIEEIMRVTQEDQVELE